MECAEAEAEARARARTVELAKENIIGSRASVGGLDIRRVDSGKVDERYKGQRKPRTNRWGKRRKREEGGRGKEG